MGKLIILDGPNYAGKTTIAKKLAKKINGVYFREPGSTEFTEKLRKLIFEYNNSLDIDTSFYLFQACRNELFIKEIEKELQNNKNVILDRSFISTIVYQNNITETMHCFNNLIEKMNCDFIIHLFYITANKDVLLKRQKQRGIGKCFDENVEETLEKYERVYEINKITNFMPAPLNKIINNISEKSVERILKIINKETKQVMETVEFVENTNTEIEKERNEENGKQ